MIDISAERVLTLTKAAGILPHRRRGSRPHVATLYRWAQRGLRGVRLETLRVGGTLCTSVEALQRFFDALGDDPASAATTPRREGQIRSAERVLEEAGI